MKFELIGWNDGQLRCLDELVPVLGVERGEGGMPLQICSAPAPGCAVENGRAVIRYAAPVQIWRQLGLLCEMAPRGEDFDRTELPAYEDLCAMLDCSRNGVLTPEAVKDVIRLLVVMGYTSLQLYTEDTYRIEGQPYFGYQRGAYTREELTDMDAYAAMFGVELVPCIQTLAHLDCVLRWKEYEVVRDFGNILLADEPKSYELIRAMFAQMAGSLRSRRINIGMDEAHMLGLGQFLDRFGYQDRMEIMLRHYRRVMDIAKEFGYEPMMWSDMFFRLATHGEYYTDGELEIDPKVKELVGEDVTLVYWDYYTLEQEKYDRMFASHKKICDRLAFAGGAWKWEGPCPNSWYSRAVAPVAHRSCRKHGVRQVLVTAWGDNGDECPLYAVLPAFQQWAELCYTDNDDDFWLETRFRTCTGGSFDDFLHLGDGAVMPDNPVPGRCGVNPTRALLYQDLLGGLFDAHADPAQPPYLRECARRMEEARDRAPRRWQYLFETQRLLDLLLADKCTLGLDIRDAYARRDRDALLRCRERALALLPGIEALLRAVEDQWLRENKIFGLDVLQLQMGGLKERINFAARRLQAFAQGELPALPELEESPLPFYGSQCTEKAVVSPPWRSIATAGNH